MSLVAGRLRAVAKCKLCTSLGVPVELASGHTSRVHCKEMCAGGVCHARSDLKEPHKPDCSKYVVPLLPLWHANLETQCLFITISPTKRNLTLAEWVRIQDHYAGKETGGVDKDGRKLRAGGVCNLIHIVRENGDSQDPDLHAHLWAEGGVGPANKDTVRRIKAEIHRVVFDPNVLKLPVKLSISFLNTPLDRARTLKYLSKDVGKAHFLHYTNVQSMAEMKALCDEYHTEKMTSANDSKFLLKMDEIVSFALNERAQNKEQLGDAKFLNFVVWGLENNRFRFHNNCIAPTKGKTWDRPRVEAYWRLMVSKGRVQVEDVYRLLIGEIPAYSNGDIAPHLWNPKYAGIPYHEAKMFVTEDDFDADLVSKEYEESFPRPMVVGASSNRYLISRTSLRPWQEFFARKFEVDADPISNRTVHILIDSLGNIGKSYLAKFLVQNFAFIIVTATNRRDMIYGIYQFMEEHHCGPRGVIVDAARATKNVCYDALEDIVDGQCQNEKYKPKLLQFNSPHIVILTNNEPDLKKLSIDRPIVWRLGIDASPDVHVRGWDTIPYLSPPSFEAQPDLSKEELLDLLEEKEVELAAATMDKNRTLSRSLLDEIVVIEAQLENEE